VNLELPEAAVEFAAAAEKAVLAAGGTDLARRAEDDPDVRTGEVAAVLGALGVSDLDGRYDLEPAAAAAELVRVAGRYALPWPAAAVLAGGGRPVAIASPGRRVDHGDLAGPWRLADLDGGLAIEARPAGGRLGTRLGPFVTEMAGAGPAQVEDVEVALALTLPAWRILGALERALEMAVDHVRSREQFGQALARFQAVQFQVADAAVAVDGLRQLCRYTLWRVITDPASRRVDPLALRLHALDSARLVLRASQQLFGASGLCDEYDISVLVRHLQPDLRLPWGAEATAERLFSAVAAEGFDSLFPHGGQDRRGA
jgi:acyl-CoA dehydrogenase